MHFRAERVEQILCVGDIADGQGDFERCIALLQDAQAICVRGNHDRWLLGDKLRDLPHAHRLADLSDRAVAFFQALPPTRRLGDVLLCHGVGDDDMQRLGPDDEGYALTANLALQTLLAHDLHTCRFSSASSAMEKKEEDQACARNGSLYDSGIFSSNR